jgi:hypothetical protein
MREIQERQLMVWLVPLSINSRPLSRIMNKVQHMFRYVTSPARKRETPLSEMSPTSMQTKPHNVRLWPFCVFNLVPQALLCRPISFHGQNTVLVVLVVVLSRAALGATLVPTPARSLPTPFSAIRSFYGHRYNRGARHP